MLKILRNIVPKGGFWRDLTLVAGGTAIGQMVSILAAPVLSRLYGPADFGTLAVYTSFTSVVAAVSSLSYHLAIPVPREDDEAARLTLLSLLSVVAVSALAAVAVFAFPRAIAALVPAAKIDPYLFFIPLGILGLGSYEVVTQWAARSKEFAIIARTSATRSVIQVSTQLIGGAARLGALGLVLGQLFGQWSGTLSIGKKALGVDGATAKRTTARALAATASAHKRFPLLTTPGVVIAALDANSAPLLFAYFFGATVTGYFALGQRLLSIPFLMIGSSAQKVFFPLAAAAHHKGNLSEETDRMFRRLAIIACPLVFLLSSSAPEIFAVLLGRQWREAGTYLQWLSLRSCFTLVVFPLIPLMYVLGKQALGTMFNIAQLVVRVGAIYIGSLHKDAHLAVALLGIGTSVLWVGYLFYLLSLKGNTFFDTLKVLGKEICIGALLATPILVLKLLKQGDLTVAAGAAASTVLAAGVVLRRLTAEGAPLPTQSPSPPGR